TLRPRPSTSCGADSALSPEQRSEHAAHDLTANPAADRPCRALGEGLANPLPVAGPWRCGIASALAARRTPRRRVGFVLWRVPGRRPRLGRSGLQPLIGRIPVDGVLVF